MTGRIKNYELSNFGPYLNYTFDFDKNQESDFNVIIGTNAFGKTSLLNSFRWLLYQDGQLKKFKNESNKGEETIVKLSLCKNDVILNLTRIDEKSSIYLLKDSDSKPLDFNSEINKLLPQVVKDFFLFKGEFLNNLFEEYNNEELENAILEISKLKKVNQIIDALETNQENYLRNINKNENYLKKNQEVLEKYEKCKKVVKKIEEHISEYEKQKKEIQSNLNQVYEDQMSITKNSGSISQMLEQRKNLEIEKKKLEAEKKDYSSKVKKKLIEKYSFNFLENAFINFYKKIEKMEIEGEIPPLIDPQIILESIEECKCKVCSSDINSDKLSELKDLLSKASKAKNRMPIYDVSKKYIDFKISHKNNLEDFDEDILVYNNIREKILNIDKEINTLSFQIGNFNEEDFYNLERHKSNLDRNLLRVNEDISQQKARLNEAKIEEEIFKNKLSSMINTTRESIDSRKYELASELRKNFILLSKDIKNSFRKSLEVKTQDYYNKIFDSTNHSKLNIQINEDFKVLFVSETGSDRLNEGKLSTGQYKVLSLSFLLALSDFYGFDFPLIIDAPFSDLDTPLRIQLLDSLLEISKDKQIIIFTLPNLEDELLQRLNESSNSVYRLVNEGEVVRLK